MKSQSFHPMRAAVLAGLLLSMLYPYPAAATPKEVVQAGQQRLQLQTLASGLDDPWSIAFLPDGRLLVTEKPGRLRVVEHGRLLRLQPVR